MISLIILALAVCGFADNTISFDLEDFRNNTVNIGFEVNLPHGQKLNPGAPSNIKIEEKINNQWVNLKNIDLNKKTGFFGSLPRFQESLTLNQETNKIRVVGTLYHCPKPGVVKGKDNICIIQDIFGESSRSEVGVSTLMVKIKATMGL